MRVRPATPAELPAVMTVLDAGYLDVDAATVRDRIGEDAVLVAVESGAVLGALVLADATITAVAVRPGRRDQGIGTALVEAAADRVEGRLTATFDPAVRSFYDALGFAVERVGDGERLRGRFEG